MTEEAVYRLKSLLLVSVHTHSDRTYSPYYELRQRFNAHSPLLLLMGRANPQQPTYVASFETVVGWNSIGGVLYPKSCKNGLCHRRWNAYTRAPAVPSLKVGVRPAWYFCRPGRPSFGHLLRLAAPVLLTSPSLLNTISVNSVNCIVSVYLHTARYILSCSFLSMQKTAFILRKSNKSVAARDALIGSNMHQIVCRLGPNLRTVPTLLLS